MLIRKLMNSSRHTKDGLAAMKRLRDLQRWYEVGYYNLLDDLLIYPSDNLNNPDPDQQLALRAGQDDAAKDRPARGIFD